RRLRSVGVHSHGPKTGRGGAFRYKCLMPESQATASFGRYQDAILLGSGGMGAVYRALDPSLDRYVAIKVLTHRDPRYVERFRREAQVLARIGHPAIIQIYEIVGSDDDTIDPYIVMEYFDGQPLDLLLKQGPLAHLQVISVVRQCADGLRRAHANNIVHRDIKPGNIMMSAAGEVKILDFGVAKLRDAKKDLTGEAVLGTPYYMSPEQATGYAIDARSDIYSLGITAFQLLTGRKPFEAKSKVDVMLMQVKTPLPQIAQFVSCDERVVGIVEKMCAKKPAERYPSCDELIASIDARPGGARRWRPRDRLGVAWRPAESPEQGRLRKLRLLGPRVGAGRGRSLRPARSLLSHRPDPRALLLSPGRRREQDRPDLGGAVDRRPQARARDLRSGASRGRRPALPGVE